MESQGSTPKASRPRRVAVIGGGPGGVIASRFLKASGHDPVVFERDLEFGGTWGPEPTNKVIYEGLVTNIPTVCMQSFDLDFPSHLPSYISAADLGRYLVDYADTFGIRPLAKFGACVTSVRPLCSEEEEAKGKSSWRVKWSQAPGAGASAEKAGKDECTEDFDAVVVASGHYEIPYQPEVPGQAEFLSASPAPGARKVVHAHSYDKPSSFASRVVLVVGGRSSGVDIARELVGIATWVYVLDKSCKEVISVESCTHVPRGSRLGSDGQLFSPESNAQAPGPPVQDIVLATGYQYTFPFLDSEEVGLSFGPVCRYIEPLYQHVVHMKRPSLCFVGVPLAVPCPIPLMEAQARYIASYLNWELTTADREESEVWLAARKAEVGDKMEALHFLQGESWPYIRELTEASGIRGHNFEAFCQRLATVEAIYNDRVSKRPQIPWGDDSYRRCEYSVNWTTHKWEVSQSKT